MANSNLLKGIIIGAAVVGLAPLVMTAMGGRRDALGRGLVRAGGVIGQKARETAAELAEVAEDMAADLQAEETVAAAAAAAAKPAAEPNAKAGNGADAETPVEEDAPAAGGSG